jgi:hypothetical protein
MYVGAVLRVQLSERQQCSTPHKQLSNDLQLVLCVGTERMVEKY